MADMMRFRRRIRVHRMTRVQMHSSMLRIYLTRRHQLEAMCLTRVEMLPLLAGLLLLPSNGCSGLLQA